MLGSQNRSRSAKAVLGISCNANKTNDIQELETIPNPVRCDQNPSWQWQTLARNETFLQALLVVSIGVVCVRYCVCDIISAWSVIIAFVVYSETKKKTTLKVKTTITKVVHEISRLLVRLRAALSLNGRASTSCHFQTDRQGSIVCRTLRAQASRIDISSFSGYTVGLCSQTVSKLDSANETNLI